MKFREFVRKISNLTILEVELEEKHNNCSQKLFKNTIYALAMNEDKTYFSVLDKEVLFFYADFTRDCITDRLSPSIRVVLRK